MLLLLKDLFESVDNQNVVYFNKDQLQKELECIT